MSSEGYYTEQYGAAEQYENEQDYGEYEEAKPKLGNNLPVWGNARTMNINNLILTNIQSSPYFKVKLYELKTYHEVVDEIYYKIDNLEPWERGSRKTAGQTGMCGGVRGVGTGGIVSTSYCILYKLFTLKLTRKQLNGMLNHTDSPYIRGLGFMYIRYCQPPKDLYSWFEPYLDDEEEIDVKAGGGARMTIGAMVRTLLTKLEWYDTLFPRIPVPIQKQIEEKLKTRMMAQKWARNKNQAAEEVEQDVKRSDERMPSRSRSQQADRSRQRSRSRSHSRKHSRRRSYDRDHGDRGRSSSDKHRDRASHDKYERNRRDDHKKSKRSRSRDKKRRSRSHSPKHSHKKRSRSRSHERKKKKKSHDRDRNERKKDRSYRD